MPKGWSPEGTFHSILYTVILSSISVVMWTGTRQRELNSRANWMRMQELTEEVVRFHSEASETGTIDTPNDTATDLGSWALKWLGCHVHSQLGRVVEVSSARHHNDVGECAWVVNATPFNMELVSVASSVSLTAWSFREGKVTSQEEITIQLATPDTEIDAWKQLPSRVELGLT